ncbi:MAG: DUF4102 domain-containing protein [Rhizobiaceae bacterium]|nr:MAG: DUF4102 domain-containing protein [Rhizobiaceae bacterium]
MHPGLNTASSAVISKSTLYFWDAAMTLTDVQCRNAKPRERRYNLTDGRGLFLLVKPNGSKLWRQDYAFEGIRRTANFGPYPATSLAQARERRDALKLAIKEGRDPAAKAEDTRPTFEKIAREWFAANVSKWKTSYSARFWKRIEVDILPGIGSKAIADIEPLQVLEALRAIEGREAVYTARRIHQMVNLVFKFAVVSGHIKHNPAADLHVALKPVPKERHRSALKEADLPVFFRKLAQYDGERQTALALKAVAHTFVRTSELRFARWSEFESDIWRIPAERMKMGREHLVPLTRQTKALFEELRALAKGSEWVLPGPRTAKPISENTLLYALYRLGYRSRASVHGFRATASTILNESGLWRDDVIERQLAHVPEDQIRAAYNRGSFWEERIRMMQWFSDLLDRHERIGIANDLSDLLG